MTATPCSALALNGIGRYWLIRDEVANAMLHFRQAMPYALQNRENSEEPLVETNINLSAAFIQQQQPDSSVLYARQAVLLAKRVGVRYFVSGRCGR